MITCLSPTELAENLLKLALQNPNRAQFCNLTYRTKERGELQRVQIILGTNTENMYQADIDYLRTKLATLKLGTPMWHACSNTIASMMESLRIGVGHNPAYVHAPENADTYYIYARGVWQHRLDGTLYVRGSEQSKTVLEAGKPQRDPNPNTIGGCKQILKKELRIGTFKQYTLDRVTRAALEKTVLELSNA